MKIQNALVASIVFAAGLCVMSCSSDTNVVSKPQFKVGTTITGTTLTGSVKGTMVTGTTYYFGGPITVNAGDTLVMQNDVKLLATDPSALLIINGVFISLGSKEKPNWITGQDAYANPSTYKQTTYVDPNTDKGLCLTCLNGTGKLWGGIQCSATATMLNLKWTHLDFAGGTVPAGSALTTGFYAAGDALFVTMFQNPDGIFIMEDCWIYGSTSDAARVKAGKIHFMRNTLEKVAFNDGDGLNVKGGTVGDMAYNLIIGTAKGGTKASNKGIAVGASQTNINMYNNTYINCGWRSLDPDRGANVNYEQGAMGLAFNNIMVNCKTGLRILENPKADTTTVVRASGDTQYGNNLFYGDSLKVTGQFLPSSHLGKLNTTDIPAPGTYYTAYTGSHWFIIAGSAQAAVGSAATNGYDGTSLIGKNNPKFVGYPLPSTAAHLRDITWADGFDFHLATGSPAINAGNSAFAPLNATVAVTNPYLAATVTPPNKDLGAYPTDGTGNKH